MQEPESFKVRREDVATRQDVANSLALTDGEREELQKQQAKAVREFREKHKDVTKT